jgi:tetratricopeptide (TPR) repeat protein
MELARCSMAAAVLGLCAVACGQTREAEFEQYVTRAAQAQSAGDVQGAIAAYKGAVVIQPRVPEIWSNLGLMQHQAGENADALESFGNAHRLQPKLFVPVLFLGLEELELGRPKEALPYLEQARTLNSKDANVPMYLGRAYFAMKEYDAAAKAYAQATKLNEKSGDAWYRLGLSQLEVAEVDAGALATLNRQSTYFRALEAETLSSQDKLDRAATAYQSVLEAESPPPCMRGSLGFVLLRQGKMTEATAGFQKDLASEGCSIARLGLLRAAFEREGANTDLTSLGVLWKTDAGFVESHLAEMAVGLTPERFAVLDGAFDRTAFAGVGAEEVARMKAALHGAVAVGGGEGVRRRGVGAPMQAVAAYRRGEYRACVDRLLPAMETMSRERVSLLAGCAFLTGDFNKTIAAATKLKHLRGAEDEGLYWSIRARQGLGVRSLMTAGEAEPNSIHLHELLAESYRDMGRYGAAETEYGTALAMEPNNFPALLGAAANYLQEYRLEPAAEMIGRALEERSSDPEANYISGEVLVDQHRFDEAEPHLRAGLGSKAELLPRVHALLGRVYASQNKDQQAIEEFKLGLASDDDGSIHFQLGRLYQKAGEQKLAEAAFEETRRLQKGH